MTRATGLFTKHLKSTIASFSSWFFPLHIISFLSIMITVSINNRKATVAFSQPVDPETKLSVLMRGVNTPGYNEPGANRTWAYRVYAKNVGLNGEIPLGLAQIQTYGT